MRVAVRKTYKMYINGAFVRSESNRSLVHTVSGSEINTPRATRKDVRDSVKAALDSQQAWSGRTAYNRGQILYRMAEMLEGRAPSFTKDVGPAVDCLVHYAGWADKYAQLLGTVNPVAAPYFNFTYPEPVGVVALACGPGLLSLVSGLASAIVGGNSVLAVAADESAVDACEFGEVLATSDLPAGVVNILVGRQSETLPTIAKHMDVQSIGFFDRAICEEIRFDAAENMKRLIQLRDKPCLAAIMDFQEMKTVWHPIGL